jgi:hypothetical protein
MKRTSQSITAVLSISFLVGCYSSDESHWTNRGMDPDQHVYRELADRYNFEQARGGFMGTELADRYNFEQARGGFMGTQERDFWRHYGSIYANSGMTYEQVRPAYRFGYLLASDPQYRRLEWSHVQSEARSEWEAGYPGSWNRYQDAVHYGWQLRRPGPVRNDRGRE